MKRPRSRGFSGRNPFGSVTRRQLTELGQLQSSREVSVDNGKDGDGRYEKNSVALRRLTEMRIQVSLVGALFEIHHSELFCYILEIKTALHKKGARHGKGDLPAPCSGVGDNGVFNPISTSVE